MAAGRDRPASGRGPLLYGVIAVLVGVSAAIVFGLAGGGAGQVAASGSPPPIAVASAAPSPSESLLTPEPSTNPSQSATTEPSVMPTAAPTTMPSPTPAPTRAPTPVATPRATPRATPTADTRPRFTSITIPKTEDCTGNSAGTISISWEVANATGVTLSIDGPGLFDSYPGTSGTVDVPFACSHEQLTHTYTLTTTGGSGVAASSTSTVTAAAARIRSFTVGQPSCPDSVGSVGIDVAYEIAAATGVQLDIDGAIYGTFSGKTSSNGLTVPYDCTKASQMFVLTTTGGYGPEATTQVVVTRGS